MLSYCCTFVFINCVDNRINEFLKLLYQQCQSELTGKKKHLKICSAAGRSFNHSIKLGRKLKIYIYCIADYQTQRRQRSQNSIKPLQKKRNLTKTALLKKMKKFLQIQIQNPNCYKAHSARFQAKFDCLFVLCGKLMPFIDNLSK